MILRRCMLFVIVLAGCGASLVSAADPIRLWAGAAPGALGEADHDIPTITPYLPAADKVSGTSIVVCPGGGYGGLAGHEGEGYAKWLADNGVAAFVLKYRLGSKGYRHPVMLGDVSRAIRLVRSRAAEWKLDPQRVGVMGSSAGGHLASTAVTHFDAGKADASDTVDRQSSRPDFGVLCYAVISMEDGVTHGGSKANLLGKDPDRNWSNCSQTRSKSRRPRRRVSSGARRKTKPSPSRTRCVSSPRCSKAEWPTTFTSTKRPARHRPERGQERSRRR